MLIHRPRLSLLFTLVIVSMSTTQPVGALPVSKGSGTANLDQTSSWTSGALPTSADVATWDTNWVSGSLGSSQSWAGISVTGGFTSFSILNTPGATLTLGASGIDMSTTTGINSFIIAAPILLGANQTWTGSSVAYASGTAATALTVAGGLDLGTYTLTVNANNSNRLKLNSALSNGTVNFALSGSALQIGSITGNYGSGVTFTGASGGTVDIRSSVTFNSLLNFATAGSVSINAAGSYVTLANTGNKFQTLSVPAGIVAGSVINALFGTTYTSSFGNGGASTAIALGNSTSGVLQYTGITASTARTFTRDYRSPASGIEVAQAGQTLTISGNLSSGSTVQTGAYGWVLGGAGNLTLTGIVSNSTGVGSVGTTVTKYGTGTVTLSGTNSYTGNTFVNAGTLTLTNAGTISATSAITLGGGVFNLDNPTAVGATTKSLGALNTVSGDSTLMTTRTANLDEKLQFASMTGRGLGSTLNFVSGGGTLSTTNGFGITGVAGNAYDRGFYYNGSSYAWYDAGQFIRAMVYGSDAGTTTSGAAASLASATHQQITGDLSSQATAAFTTFNISGSRNITLAPGAVLDLGSLLKSGTGASTISGTSGAALTGATAGELILRTDLSSDSLLLSVPVQGANALSKSGAGTLTLASANTYTGATYLNGGTTIIASNDSLGAAGTGATLYLNNATLQATASFGLYNGTAGTNNRAVSLSGAGGTFDVTGANKLTIAGVISGTGPLLKNNTGALVLSGLNTATGPTVVNAGTLQYAKRSSLYNSGGATLPASWNPYYLTVKSGATLALNVGGASEFTSADLAVLNGVGTSIGGLLPGSTLALDTTNASAGFTYASALTNSNSGANSISLTKLGANTLTLSGANTYTGITTIEGGTLQFAKTSALYGGNSANWLAPSIIVKAGATLGLNVGGVGEFSISDVSQLAALGTAATGLLDQAILALDPTNATSATFTVSNALGNTNGGANRLALSKVGSASSVLDLTAANTYTGGTLIGSGILRLGVAENAGVSGPLGASGTLSFNGGTLQYSALNAFDYSSRFSTAANQAYLIDTNGQNVTFATALSSTGGALTKSGAGSLTLSAANTYTGATTINAGSLIVNGSLGAGAVTVNATATLGGSGTLGGATTIASGGLLNPGTSPGLLSFSSGLTLASGSTTTMEIGGALAGTGHDQIAVTGALVFGGTLNITNYGGYNLAQAGTYTLFTFGSQSGNFSAVNVDSVLSTPLALAPDGGTSVWSALTADNTSYSFNPTTGTFTVTPGGGGGAVPEPSTYALFAGLGSLALAAYRRRRAQRTGSAW